MSLMQSALRITDRFYDARDPESIERQGRLQNCIVLVFIFHMMMVVAFIKLQEYEAAHPRIIRDVDVSFEFAPPPPEAAPKPLQAEKMDMPAIKAPALTTPTNVPARPVPSRRTTQAAPVAVTPTNV